MTPPITQTHCSTCGAKIVWVEDVQGTRFPVNARRARAYRLRISLGARRPRVIAEVLTADDGGEDGITFDETGEREVALVHLSHFLTCPQAAQHSRAQRKPTGEAHG